MKIVFTAKGDSWESLVDARFGRMDMLVTYDEERDVLEAQPNDETEAMEHGAGLQTAKKVLKLNPDVIITGNGAGGKALDILKTSDVKIFVGAGDMTLQDAYAAYKNSQLAEQK